MKSKKKNDDELFVEEYFGRSLRKCYQEKNNFLIIHNKSIESAIWMMTSNFFASVFLPHGYPDSVSNDYLQYQLWDSIQAFASSITGSISTHALLKGAGVGDASASTLAATMAWVLKDGTSMFGRIVFSWLYGTKLDCDCKKWRLFADILNDVALLLDLISAHFTEHYVLILCVSGVFKSVVGVAGGATRAALTQHQARKNNMADVSAKDGSQETLVNLAALICSLIILPVVAEKQALIWILYMVMTIIHLTANYLAVKSVEMETFNTARFLLCMQQYVSSSMTYFASVKEINQRESVFLFSNSPSMRINIGVSFQTATRGKEISKIVDLLDLHRNSDYFLTLSESDDNVINVCLSPNATVTTQLEAMYQACLLQNMCLKSKMVGEEGFLWDHYRKDMALNDSAAEVNLEKFTRKITEECFPTFLQRTEACGWKTNVALFNTDLWRIKWGSHQLQQFNC